jgi:RHS repeat-associated protein
VPMPAGFISDPIGPDNSIGYAGYMFSLEVQLYCQRFRWYSPVTGRWLQRDPAGPVDGTNLYQYVRSSPVRYNDSSGANAEEPDAPPPPWLDPSDPRNDKSKGCGISVKQEDIGPGYGHRWIEIDDPGRGPRGSPEARRAQVSKVGRQWRGFISPYEGYYGGKPDCDNCTGNDAEGNTAHTEWDVKEEQNAKSKHWRPVGIYSGPLGPQRQWGWAPHPIHPGAGVLRFGPSAGVHVSGATCEQIRECLYSYRSNGSPYIYAPGFNNCRPEADNILGSCGLKKTNRRRTPEGREEDAQWIGDVLQGFLGLN